MNRQNEFEKQQEQEELFKIANRNEMDAVVANSIHGLELRKGEKRRYLGQFRERVLKTLTNKQLGSNWIYPDVIEAIKDRRSTKIIIRSDYRKKAKKYLEIAQRQNKTVTITNNKDYIGNIALVVVSDEAVEVDNIIAGEKTQELKDKGLPPEIINAGCGKLCSSHYQQLLDVAGETLNFKQLSFLEKMFGEVCTACQYHNNE
ncbi:MAG: DUF1694 domain-containing protein [Firmicutes bacterium]|nr:DUF1694 domain-containing protein [Bacillota bacterium]